MKLNWESLDFIMNEDINERAKFIKHRNINCLASKASQGHSGKESTCQCRRFKRPGFHPWAGKIPWSRKWQPTPVFLPGKSHGQRSPAGYSPWGRRVRHDWAHIMLMTERGIPSFFISSVNFCQELYWKQSIFGSQEAQTIKLAWISLYHLYIILCIYMRRKW